LWSDRGFLGAGIDRHIAFEVSDLDTLMELVSRGLGSPGVAGLAEPEICWELVVAYSGGEGPAQAPADHAPRAFLELLNGAK
jgi:hypothetical protein